MRASSYYFLASGTVSKRMRNRQLGLTCSLTSKHPSFEIIIGYLIFIPYIFGARVHNDISL